MTKIDDDQRQAFEAAAFRRLVQHLRGRSDVQNIDLMNLAGFCRNCLANWFQEAAAADGVEIAKPQAREMIYGMSYEEWQALNRTQASPQALATFAKDHQGH